MNILDKIKTFKQTMQDKGYEVYERQNLFSFDASEMIIKFNDKYVSLYYSLFIDAPLDYIYKHVDIKFGELLDIKSPSNEYLKGLNDY